MVAIDQVPAWWEESGISHVVSSCGDSMYLLCGRWIVCGPVRSSELASKPGKRICRKCRARLAVSHLRPTEEPAPAATERRSSP